MIRNNYRSIRASFVWLMAIAIFVMPVSGLAQTKIILHSNRYKPSDDVQVGRQAAAEVEQQMPILRDADATNTVSRVGQRLGSAIPPELKHPEFQYYFKIVNAREINAFALPGGPMYVNRGTIEAAASEAELAGVLAHEMSHVALRHGTHQASTAYLAQTGLGILGGLLGKNGGSAAGIVNAIGGLG